MQQYKPSDEQLALFKAFGFLKLPGFLRDDMRWIETEFENVFENYEFEREQNKRAIVIQFIDQTELLCSLLDHPKIDGLLSALLGSDYGYFSSDGNLYVGDTPWHFDASIQKGVYVKLGIYLDFVGQDSGCLRVIPGSHILSDRYATLARNAAAVVPLATGPTEIVPGTIPFFALESSPGDLVAFNINILHSSFGGGARRRMLAVTAGSKPKSAEEVNQLRTMISQYERFGLETMHGTVMKGTADARRRRHLEPVAQCDDVLMGRSGSESLRTRARSCELQSEGSLVDSRVAFQMGRDPYSQPEPVPVKRRFQI